MIFPQVEKGEAPEGVTSLSYASLRSDYIHPNAAEYRRLAKSAALLKKSGAVE